ncbi:hypothetical protein D3C72_2068630 [compost metagenome]
MTGWRTQTQLAQDLLTVLGVGGHTQQNHIGLELFRQSNCGQAIACITDYGVMFLLFEQRAQASSKERRVIGK